jgi:hypothetical protein
MAEERLPRSCPLAFPGHYLPDPTVNHLFLECRDRCTPLLWGRTSAALPRQPTSI